MATTLAGLRHWEVRFDAGGNHSEGSEADALLGELAWMRDVFVFSHGWNNDAAFARRLYARFFEQFRAVLERHAAGVDDATIGTVGVIWPSMRWPDEQLPDGAGQGGAAAITLPGSDAELVRELKAVFVSDEQRKALDDLADLLESRPDDGPALARFQDRMATLAGEPDIDHAIEDAGEAAMLEQPPETVFARFAAEVPRTEEGGAAGLSDLAGRLWDGAKEALRQLTYWQMKKRAGAIGRSGLGPLIGRMADAAPELRIHLIGHSFGGRLVSFGLAGMPEAALIPASPVKSVLVLQGAFSHFAFADALPHDRSRGGALRGMAARVDGPLVITHSTFDRAVGTFYPLASITAGDDAAALSDRLYRWGAMGHDGAQAVAAASRPLAPVGQTYEFQAGRFLNLDGNQIITQGGPPSGAHSDIFHPEIAWAALTAAGLAGRR